MKNFRIEDGVFDIFPSLEIGVITVTDADNRSGGRADLLTEACSGLRAELEKTDGMHPYIAQYKDAMKQIRKKKGAAASIEAMAKRIAKGADIGSVNTAVDLYNYISLKHLFTCGGETLDRIQGDMVLGFARGDEAFIPLGEEENSPPREGELIYYDCAGAIVRSWLWREADRTRITEESTSLLLYMESIDPQRSGEMHSATEELAELIAENLGGTVRTGRLSTEVRTLPLGI